MKTLNAIYFYFSPIFHSCYFNLVWIEMLVKFKFFELPARHTPSVTCCRGDVPHISLTVRLDRFLLALHSRYSQTHTYQCTVQAAATTTKQIDALTPKQTHPSTYTYTYTNTHRTCSILLHSFSFTVKFSF